MVLSNVDITWPKADTQPLSHSATAVAERLHPSPSHVPTGVLLCQAQGWHAVGDPPPHLLTPSDLTMDPCVRQVFIHSNKLKSTAIPRVGQRVTWESAALQRAGKPPQANTGFVDLPLHAAAHVACTSAAFCRLIVKVCSCRLWVLCCGTTEHQWLLQGRPCSQHSNHDF